LDNDDDDAVSRTSASQEITIAAMIAFHTVH